MALVTCPGCKKRISEFADSCPHCGSRFSGDCPECGTAREVNAEKCSKCGYPFSRLDAGTTDSTSGPSSAEVRAALENQPAGDTVLTAFGFPTPKDSREIPKLAVAFWVYLIVIGHLGTSMISGLWSMVSAATALLPLIAAFVYLLWAWTIVWRSADRYVGKRVWSILAKVYVVIDVVSVAIVAIYFLAVFASLN